MSQSPNWLSTLQRVREHRRDASLLSLAQTLAAAAHIRESIRSVERAISGLSQIQQQCIGFNRVDSARLLQIRQDRDALWTQLADLRQQHSVAEAAIEQAQAVAAEKDGDVEILRRLSDRYDSASRQTRRRLEEQSSIETFASLCNGQVCD